MRNKPLLIFDGTCDFCRMWIDRWKDTTADTIDYAPYQEVSPEFPDIPINAFQRSVVLVEPDGRISKAAEAVFRALSYVPRKKWIYAFYQKVPPFAAVSEAAYRVIAGHRNFFLRITHALWGKSVRTSTYEISEWIFFRALAVIFLIAFASLWIQLPGLVGSNGIIPVKQFLDFVKDRAPEGHYWLVPSLCWISTSDAFLHFLCGSGVVLSILLFAGVLPSLILFLLWLLYLSLAAVCQDFLSFQWDVLLLETAFVAIFLAPHRLFAWRAAAPTASRKFLWLARWLLFRLVFSSGAVKLLSRDPTWRSLTALRYHYETQPLPTWIGWYMHQLPPWFQSFSVLFVLFCELVTPFFIFTPRRFRKIAFVFLVGLQILIFLTGNYCFFNLLSLALCLLLIEDTAWPRWIRERRLPNSKSATSHAPAVHLWIGRLIAIFLFVLSLIQMSVTLNEVDHVPAVALGLLERAEPFRTVNRYGLFAVMTTTRPEIILEGSNDGQNWSAYEFKYKPGDLKRAPAFVEPHQPRLDWQMWFAALESYRSNDWFIPFCRKLLQGSPQVLALMQTNPFPQHPPRYLRARVYQYHFTTRVEKAGTGEWWKRQLQGEYSPVFTLNAER